MIVSTTLTGSNAAIIGDALASVVAQVDRCLVIDTGATDDSIDVARAVAGPKLDVRTFKWQDDFAAARNFALDAAAELGGTWAVTVDTDERLLFDPGVQLSRLLAATRADVCMVLDDLGNYSKERIVRLPAKVRWAGPTHECLEGRTNAGTATLQGLRFHELPKDPAAARRKFERDLAILKRYTRQHGKQARWLYYLGTTHQHLGDYAAAIDAFRTCAELRGWEEEGAWACYHAAECCCSLRRWDDALQFCAAGLAIRPATAELAWLAGFAAYKGKRFVDAVAWSNMAIANGLYRGQGAQFERIGFRHPPALYEGPYDILRWAYQGLGNAAAAAAATAEYERAKAMRESGASAAATTTPGA
ncbi:MAG: glycosyltransferase [Gammaproteobacteria bacterium]|nr:glycosyltransferase [Gammaproteobacteria bacterium]